MLISEFTNAFIKSQDVFLTLVNALTNMNNCIFINQH